MNTRLTCNATPPPKNTLAQQMYRRKHKAYLKKSRSQRKRDTIGIKNNIRRSASVLGGHFYTHDYLYGGNGWADIYFLGRQPLMFYNATLETTAYAFREKAEALAFDRSCKLVPYRSVLLERLGDSNTVNTDDLEEPIVSDAFEGLDRRQWVEREVVRFIEEGEVTVYEKVKLDCSYSFGLIATLDVPAITVETVNDFVDEFLTNGERSWKGRPVAFAPSIIDKTRKIESNLLIEPWEWNQVQKASA